MVEWVCPECLHELCRFSVRQTRRNLQELRHVYDLTTKTEIAREVQISVHVETAGHIPVSQFCTAKTGSGKTGDCDHRRSPCVGSGSPADDIPCEPGDTCRRTTALDDQSDGGCSVVVLRDGRYLSRPAVVYRKQLINVSVLR